MTTVVDYYLDMGEVKKALTVLSKISRTPSKQNELLIEAVKRNHKKGDIEKSLKINQEIRHDSFKEEFIKSTAQSYIDEGQIAEAKKVIELSTDKDTKDSFYSKLANSYLEQKDIDRACESIELCSSKSIKDKFYNKIVKLYPEPLKEESDGKLYRNGIRKARARVVENEVTNEVINLAHKKKYDEARKKLEDAEDFNDKTFLRQVINEVEKGNEVKKALDENGDVAASAADIKKMSPSYSKDELLEKAIQKYIEMGAYAEAIDMLEQKFNSDFKRKDALRAFAKALGVTDWIDEEKCKIEIGKFFLNNHPILAAKMIRGISKPSYEKDNIVKQSIGKVAAARYDADVVTLLSHPFYSDFNRREAFRACATGFGLIGWMDDVKCKDEIDRFLKKNGNNKRA